MVHEKIMLIRLVISTLSKVTLAEVSQDDYDGLPLSTFKSCSIDFLSQHITEFFSQYVQAIKLDI